MTLQKVRLLTNLSAASSMLRFNIEGAQRALNNIDGDRNDEAEPRLAGIREKLKQARILQDQALAEISEILLPLTQESFVGKRS